MLRRPIYLFRYPSVLPLLYLLSVQPNMKVTLSWGNTILFLHFFVLTKQSYNFIYCLCYILCHVARMGEGRGVHRVLLGKTEGKRPLGKPRSRWEDNTKMDLQEVGGGCGDWMELARDRDRWRALVSTVRNLRVPKMRGLC